MKTSNIIAYWKHGNLWLAKKATSVFGSMEFFYGCCLLVALPLAFPSTEITIQYISSAVIQLVALPLIAVGSAVRSRAQDRKISHIVGVLERAFPQHTNENTQGR